MARIDTVKQQWRDAVGELDALIESSGIDRRKFNRSNQAKWIDKISASGRRRDQQLSVARVAGKILPAFLRRSHESRGETPRHPLFEAIDQLLAEPLSIRDLVITRALAEIRETVAREKRRRGELGFDDMLSRLDSALRSESGEVLAAAIRTRFPVAMIDEFQDTDPSSTEFFAVSGTISRKPHCC